MSPETVRVRMLPEATTGSVSEDAARATINRKKKANRIASAAKVPSALATSVEKNRIEGLAILALPRPRSSVDRRLATQI